MDIMLCSGSGNASHTYGNVMEAIRMMLMTKFPDNYFNYEHTSSSMAFNYFKKTDSRYNAELKKRTKPYIILKPIFEILDDDMFLSGTRLTTNTDDIEYAISRSGLGPCAVDPINHYSLFYKMNRDKMMFDVSIVVETLHEQIDLFKFLFNHFTWNRPYFHRTSLESMIPRSLIQYMSRLVNMDIAIEQNVPHFLRYLQQIALFPITYKMRNASMRDEFFLYYTPNILVTFTDLEKDDGNRKLQIEDDFTITFRITMSFNLPGQYIVTGDRRYQYDKFDASLVVNDTMGNKNFIPIYTLDNFYIPEYLVGQFQLYTNTIIKTDPEKNKKTDTLKLDVFFDEEITEVIRQHAFVSIDPGVFLRFQLTRDREILQEGVDYSIDFSKLQFHIHNADSDYTYRLITYVNNVYLTEKIIQNTHRSNQDKTFSDITTDNKS